MLPKCFRFDLTGNAATPAATGGFSEPPGAGGANPTALGAGSTGPSEASRPGRPARAGEPGERLRAARAGGTPSGERPGDGPLAQGRCRAAGRRCQDGDRAGLASSLRQRLPTAGEWAILAAILTDGVPLDLVLGVIRECRDRRMVFGSIRAAWTVRHSNGLAADDVPFTGVIA